MEKYYLHNQYFSYNYIDLYPIHYTCNYQHVLILFILAGLTHLDDLETVPNHQDMLKIGQT